MGTKEFEYNMKDFAKREINQVPYLPAFAVYFRFLTLHGQVDQLSEEVMQRYVYALKI